MGHRDPSCSCRGTAPLECQQGSIRERICHPQPVIMVTIASVWRAWNLSGPLQMGAEAKCLISSGPGGRESRSLLVLQ